MKAMKKQKREGEKKLKGIKEKKKKIKNKKLNFLIFFFSFIFASGAFRVINEICFFYFFRLRGGKK